MEQVKGVWTKLDSANHRFIIQWKAGAGSGYSTPLDFEVLLYDTTFSPTLDGNGLVVVQYNVASMNLANNFGDEPTGCSIGVQAPGCAVGLSYVYRDIYNPGSATVQSGRAILFTTAARSLFGTIQGTVNDLATSLPMQGVNISLDGYAYHSTTDVNGRFSIPNVLIGLYTVRASKHYFNDAVCQ